MCKYPRPFTWATAYLLHGFVNCVGTTPHSLDELASELEQAPKFTVCVEEARSREQGWDEANGYGKGQLVELSWGPGVVTWNSAAFLDTTYLLARTLGTFFFGLGWQICSIYIAELFPPPQNTHDLFTILIVNELIHSVDFRALPKLRGTKQEYLFPILGIPFMVQEISVNHRILNISK